MKERLAKLIDVKTIVTFVTMAIFTVLSITGRIGTDYVMTITTMVISFYFGTQSNKNTLGGTAT